MKDEWHGPLPEGFGWLWDLVDELTSEQLEAAQRVIDAQKPANFHLTPIGKPGW